MHRFVLAEHPALQQRSIRVPDALLSLTNENQIIAVSLTVPLRQLPMASVAVKVDAQLKSSLFL